MDNLYYIHTCDVVIVFFRVVVSKQSKRRFYIIYKYSFSKFLASLDLHNPDLWPLIYFLPNKASTILIVRNIYWEGCSNIYEIWEMSKLLLLREDVPPSLYDLLVYE